SSASARSARFISHANPEDNAFARWLGAKLSAMGFEVWADVMQLHGGSDWSRELENALRHRAVKMLLAASPVAIDKQGVRNEIQIGTEVGKNLKDTEFIIPLRLAPFQAPFLIAHSQYIDFSKSWAAGLIELVELLTGKLRLPRTDAKSMDVWHQAQSIGAAKLVPRGEYLWSSWLRFIELPRSLRYFEPPVGFPLEQFQDRLSHSWPMVPHAGGVLTFADASQQILPPNLPAREKGELETESFLATGWTELNLDTYAARAKFSDLANQAFDQVLRDRGLEAYGATGVRLRWWGDIRTYPLNKISFEWRHRKGRRQLMGQSGKRNVHWHYSINGQARTAPIPHFRLYAGLIFSQNGMDALDDPKKMHRLRRSFAKWRNARWRDMMLAFLWWLSNGRTEVPLPISNGQRMRLALPPMTFRSPVMAIQAGEEPADEDDPDIDYDADDEGVAGNEYGNANDGEEAAK
ncbi:MAG: toll/interleukin-1 receptor domain-containing protein, partial [Terriglobia bacterium]